MSLNTKVALIVIYNHRFDKNIEIVENIYRSRFSLIYHLVPFYDGTKDNVISVYDNSYYFEGYIAQGYKHFRNKEISHYFFVSDDMILNPMINENNYCENFLLDTNTCFIPELTDFPRDNFFEWNRNTVAFNPFDKKKKFTKGVEVKGELPTAKDALALLERHGIHNKPYSLKIYRKAPEVTLFKRIKAFFKDWLIIRIPYGKKSNYPLTSSYSDIFIVSQSVMGKFAHLCGCFSATRLFVEFAIPTALALSAEKIIQEKHLKLKGQGIHARYIHVPGNENIEPLINSCNYDLSLLLKKFPESHLYLHPIKLSKWDIKNL